MTSSQIIKQGSKKHIVNNKGEVGEFHIFTTDARYVIGLTKTMASVMIVESGPDKGKYLRTF